MKKDLAEPFNQRGTRYVGRGGVGAKVGSTSASDVGNSLWIVKGGRDPNMDKTLMDQPYLMDPVFSIVCWRCLVLKKEYKMFGLPKTYNILK
jgi:hypothetical protein